MISVKNLSIKNKLILMQLITTVFVLLIYSTFLFFNNMQMYRKSIVNQLTSMAQLIGTNSVSALNFLDNAAAEEILLSLTKEEDIVNAWIYDADENLFAKYSKDGYTNFIFPKIKKESHEFGSEFVILSKRILQDDEYIGMISLRLDMRQFQHNVEQNIIIAFFVLFLGIIITLFLSIISQKSISNPILRLAEAVRNVSKTGNYTIRIEKESKDEIGTLYDGFNNMLEQINIREVERDIAETALRENEQLLQSIIDNSTSVIYIKDIQSKYILINKQYEKLFHIEKKEIIGKTDYNVFSEDIATSLEENDRKVIESKIPMIFEENILHDDGIHTYVSNKFPLLDSTGIPKAICGISTDITNRKQAEEEIKKAKEQLQAMLDAVPGVISWIDSDLKYLGANRYLLESLNLTPSELIGKKVGFLQTSRDFMNFVTKFFKSEKKQNSKEIKSIVNNTSLYYLTIGQKYLQNKAAVFVGIDITERKKAEKEINFLAHSIKSISECVSITDLENKILFVNKSFLKTYGYKEHELIGKNINLIRSKKNSPELLDQIQPATLTKGWHGELLNTRKDGSEFPISLSTSFTRDDDGKPIALIGIATDITEPKKIEKELTKHREHLEELVKNRTRELVKINKELEIEKANIDKLFETAQEAIVMADKDGRILRVNKEFTKLFKYSFDEVLGNSIDDLIVPEDYHEEAALITKKVVTGEKVTIETIRRNKNGISIQVSVLAAPIIVDDKLEAIYAIYQDITNRKLAEAALEERAIKLTEVNIRLKEADLLKSVFLANMSHELRTPLNSIIGFTSILLMGMSGSINEEQKKQLNLVKNSSKHLLSLINEILDISKIEAGKVELFIEEFKLDDIVGEVIESFLPVLNEKGLKFLKDKQLGITLHSDKRRFKQVLMNLVSNAVKFTEQGSIRIDARVSKSNNLEICVTDTGIGIKEEDMDKLFKSFQQIDMSSSKKYEGTGLGLHLSKKLVILMGGDMSAKSEYGKGSKFTLVIPLKYSEEIKK